MALAYTDVLRWPLFLGQEEAGPQEVESAFAAETPIVLATACSQFDAVRVPYAAGRDALVTVERSGVVPCLRTRQAFTLLVAHRTGHRLADVPGVQVLAGERTRMRLPPTAGVTWDTPPWRIGEPAPVGLRAADELRNALVNALRLYPGGIEGEE